MRNNAKRHIKIQRGINWGGRELDTGTNKSYRESGDYQKSGQVRYYNKKFKKLAKQQKFFSAI